MRLMDWTGWDGLTGLYAVILLLAIVTAPTVFGLYFLLLWLL